MPDSCQASWKRHESNTNEQKIFDGVSITIFVSVVESGDGPNGGSSSETRTH